MQSSKKLKVLVNLFCRALFLFLLLQAFFLNFSVVWVCVFTIDTSVMFHTSTKPPLKQTVIRYVKKPNFSSTWKVKYM
jgi:hypothetical protein